MAYPPQTEPPPEAQATTPPQRRRFFKRPWVMVSVGLIAVAGMWLLFPFWVDAQVDLEFKQWACGRGSGLSATLVDRLVTFAAIAGSLTLMGPMARVAFRPSDVSRRTYLAFWFAALAVVSTLAVILLALQSHSFSGSDCSFWVLL